MRLYVLSIVLAVILVPTAQAERARVLALAAPMTEARWESRALSGGCTLTHTVPGYGEVRFVADLDGRLRFELDPWWRPRRADSVAVFSAPPPWRHQGERRELGKVRMEPGSEIVTASDDLAKRLLIELKQGMEVQVRHQDWVDGQDSVDLRLVPVRFERAALIFRDCVGGLARALPPPIDPLLPTRGALLR